MLKCEDFMIQFGDLTEAGYAMTVIQSPMGQAAGFFKLPFTPEEMMQTLKELGRRGSSPMTLEHATRPCFRKLVTGSLQMPEVITPRSLGGILYDALFQGDVGICFDRCLGMIATREDMGLRLVLKFNLQMDSARRLVGMPWEYLFRNDTQDFLSLSRRTPIVRYLDVPQPSKPLPLPQPLRILLVICRPESLLPLDLEDEREQLEAMWEASLTEVHVLLNATLDDLRCTLLEREFHVVHFMGHGEYDRGRDEGLLYFHDMDDRAVGISGAELGQHLAEFHSLRLIFLNACETARSSGAQGPNPFSGVAAALVLKGFSAVLAMHYPISDEAAIVFSSRFYHQLARGQFIDSAVVEGRLAIKARWSRSSEWGTPILFCRVPSMCLFEPEEEVFHLEPQVMPPVKDHSEQSSILYRVTFVLIFLVLIGWFGWWKVPQFRSFLSQWVLLEQEEQPQVTDLMGLDGVASEGDVSQSVPPPRPKVVEPPAGTEKVLILPGQVEMSFVWVPSGSFLMGTPLDASVRRKNEVPHQVRLNGFWLSQTEVTQAQWQSLMGDNPSTFIGANRPVESLSYNRARAYAEEMTVRLGGLFRLPSEAEWEYACRAETQGLFHGDSLADLAWFGGNSQKNTHEVAQKQANKWGLYDMHGNVSEWCLDWYGPYSKTPLTNPMGPVRGQSKVARGGGFPDKAMDCRAASRWPFWATTKESRLGFRLAMIKLPNGA